MRSGSLGAPGENAFPSHLSIARDSRIARFTRNYGNKVTGMAIDAALVKTALERIEADISKALAGLSQKPAVQIVDLGILIQLFTLRDFLTRR